MKMSDTNIYLVIIVASSLFGESDSNVSPAMTMIFAKVQLSLFSLFWPLSFKKIGQKLRRNPSFQPWVQNLRSACLWLRFPNPYKQM